MSASCCRLVLAASESAAGLAVGGVGAFRRELDFDHLVAAGFPFGGVLPDVPPALYRSRTPGRLTECHAKARHRRYFYQLGSGKSLREDRTAAERGADRSGCAGGAGALIL